MAALKVKGALCAAEPGTSLQRGVGELVLPPSCLGLGESDTLGSGGQGACPALGPSTGLGLSCQLPQRPQSWGLGSDLLRSPMLPCCNVPSLKMMLPLCFCFIQRCKVLHSGLFFCFSCFLSLLQQLMPAQSTWQLEELLLKQLPCPPSTAYANWSQCCMLSPWRDWTGQSHFVVPCREKTRGSSLGHELGRIERKKHSVMGIQGRKGQCPLKGLWAGIVCINTLGFFSRDLRPAGLK